MRELCTIKEAAELTGISEYTIKQYIENRHLDIVDVKLRTTIQNRRRCSTFSTREYIRINVIELLHVHRIHREIMQQQIKENQALYKSRDYYGKHYPIGELDCIEEESYNNSDVMSRMYLDYELAKMRGFI